MKRILGFITMVYGRMVRLFPSEFQEEFGEELQSVFSAMTGEAARKGKMALAVACLQELRDFPIFLIRTHLEKGHMKKFFRSQPVRFAWRGALGFSLSLALANVLVLCFHYWLLPAASTVSNYLWIDELSVLVGIGTAAVVGGVLFALLFSERTRFGWYALVGILGLFIPWATNHTLSMSLDFDFMRQYQGAIIRAILVLEGALLSTMFCVAKSGRKKLIWPLATGAVLYPLLSYLLPHSFLYSYRFQPIIKANPSWFFIALIIWMLFLLGGAIWLAFKSGGKSLWVVLAGAAGYLFVFSLCDAIITRFHLFIPAPAVHNGLAAIDIVNTGIQPIMIGIIFGVLIGLLLGWERKKAQQT